MASIEELQPFITEPREDLDAEYKGWLDLTSNEHKATLAKAAIALANHGGGRIVIGFAEQGQTLVSGPCPEKNTRDHTRLCKRGNTPICRAKVSL